MAKRKNVTIIIVLIVAILLVFSVISVILLPHIGDKSNDDTLSLVVNGVKITENADIAIMGKTITVDGCEDWKYEIVPLSENHSHLYFAEGQSHFANMDGVTTTSDIDDWTKGFDVVKSKSTITVNSTTVLKVLQKYHNTENVIVEGEIYPHMVLSAWSTEARTFKLVISSSDGKQSIALSFVIPTGG